MAILKLFKSPALSVSQSLQKKRELQSLLEDVQINSIETEYCYYIESDVELNGDAISKLLWILKASFNDVVQPESSLITDMAILIEIGPRLNFSTPFSTNAVSICCSVGLDSIKRFERSIRYLVQAETNKNQTLDSERIKIIEKQLTENLHDRMTECPYQEEITTFQSKISPASWKEVDLLKNGRKALEEINQQLGLSFDDWDLNYYTNLFRDVLKKNPTTVECFDLAQSNSEHSRHGFFKGKMIIDGVEEEEALLDMVINTQLHSNNNNVIKFSDNSSAIKGYLVKLIKPSKPSISSSFSMSKQLRHIIFTAETHNFPTGVAPFSGATTGTGGRIRDVQAAGRGAHVVAGTAAYSFGNLNIPGYNLPWEDSSFTYPSNFAKPLSVAIEASNGASDYGNKFGEPILAGFARSFGMKLPNGERREWIKPIMFTGGIGTIDGDQITKFPPVKGMAVVKLGGPVYRIGVGGGSASSVHVQGDQEAELDFGAVQRGDAEMEQKLNRVLRGCLEREGGNIIASIHDQGAGGNGNVLKELVEPAGAEILISEFQLGDPTLSALEIWGAEYQESNALLINENDCSILEEIAKREKCPVSFVGKVTGDGRVVLRENNDPNARQPFDLELDVVLGSMPRKVFKMDTAEVVTTELILPVNLTLQAALERVLRLPSVASKRYLTNKVDRSVTGLVAQQQCVGPLHTPLADVAVIALTHFETVGSATSIGEQPIKGLLNAAVGARMSLAEAITNLMFAKITSLQDVKCSGNWMWAAKLPGEGQALFAACRAMCQLMTELGVAIDGGKDSLSMAARLSNETVKAPGAIVISCYAPCPDIRKTVTPDFKCPSGLGALLYVDLSNGKSRLGGTALAQCYNQLGESSPDLEDSNLLKKGFQITQKLIQDGIISAGHDVSDGGLITCILEMAFAGNCGLNLAFNNPEKNFIDYLFAEEVGWVLEVDAKHAQEIFQAYRNEGIPCSVIGESYGKGRDSQVNISYNGTDILVSPISYLRELWEETSYQLELRQCNPECALAEFKGFKDRKEPCYRLNFNPTFPEDLKLIHKTKVAVIREEGTNGDREMVSALFLAGFEVWDVTMTDLQSGKTTLDCFRGIIFPGGFSYADVLGSAKGWAATFLFDPVLKSQLKKFRERSDTFSLGVCNGCQLQALLGWINPPTGDQKIEQGVLLEHNLSERFESRFSNVRINKSPSIMLKGMDDSCLGVWVAHGEGRFNFQNSDLLKSAVSNNLVALSFVDDSGQSTEVYPFNPNGSPLGIAALCSLDGRHLAMMPHPERCVLAWQWPYIPDSWKTSMKYTSPWMEMFINASRWCQ